ncbi:MAG: 50S ribosomal protein L17 [Myxococcota bacterium]
MHNSRGHRKLGRTSPHRMAMLRNLVTSVLEHERVTTTDAKAKEVRPIAEKVITYGKRGDLHSRRKALKIVRSRAVVGKVFDSVAKRFASRPGGYTRIIKLGRRQGDGAPLSIIELLPEIKSGEAAGSGGKKGKGKEKEKAKAKDLKQPVVKKKPAKAASAAAGRKRGKPAAGNKPTAKKAATSERQRKAKKD